MMFSRRISLAVTALAVWAILVAPASAQPAAWVAEPDPAWTDLFDRDSGWTGADGIYSIPLGGNERPGSAAGGRTLFVFSDTFIGEVDSSGVRQDGTAMVNNTLAVLTGGVPDPGEMNFLYRADENGDPASLFVPRTPSAQPDHWYWLGDGVAIDGMVHVFGLRMRSASGIGFATDGVAIVSFPVSANPGRPLQTESPLFLPDDGIRGDIIFGAGILNNTAAAGAPNPDGYIYVYGTQNDQYIKKLVAARVQPADFLDLTRWEYRTDTGWSGNITDLAPLTQRVSNELSVSPLNDGSRRFVLVFQEDAVGRYVSLRIGDGPVGPWGPIHRVFECPEPQLDPDLYTYNAKAHPSLSAPGELLISYNVNTLDFWDHFRNADIYRPRFIRIHRADVTDRTAAARATPMGLAASPNPCNPRTSISFSLPVAGAAHLAVYDFCGRRVRDLLNTDLQAGGHTVDWDGRDNGGRPAATGVYICRLVAGAEAQTVRVSLVK